MEYVTQDSTQLMTGEETLPEKQEIYLTLEVNGQDITRHYVVDEIEDIDWNEQISDIADSIESGKKEVEDEVNIDAGNENRI